MLRLLNTISWRHARRHRLRTGLTFLGMVLGVAVDPGPTGRQQALKANLSHIRNSHSFRAGVDFRQHYRTLLQNGGLTSGNFSFANKHWRRDGDGDVCGPNGPGVGNFKPDLAGAGPEDLTLAPILGELRRA